MNSNQENILNRVLNIYYELETELIKLIFRKIKANSSNVDYLLDKLVDISDIQLEATELLNLFTTKSEKEILQLFSSKTIIDHEQYYKAYKNGLIKIDPRNIFISGLVKANRTALFKELELIKGVALQSVSKAYVDTLYKAGAKVQSGAFSLNEAIKSAVLELSDNGIKVASYMRKDGAIVHYDIESVVNRSIRTTFIRTVNEANYKMIEETKTPLVIVSQHLGARCKGLEPENHFLWQGQVYKLDEIKDEKYKKFKPFKKHTGYGKMLGLGGINCRHNFKPFFLGLTKQNKLLDPHENEKEYDRTQKMNYCLRQVKKFKRAFDLTGDPKFKEQAKEYRARYKRLDNLNRQ